MAVGEMLAWFDHLVDRLQGRYEVQTLAPRVHVLKPKGSSWAGSADKPIALSMVGMIHGVEVAGLGVLCSLLELLAAGTVPLEISLGVALGNIPAAEKKVRFVERDLNRSFGREATATLEDRRADELERLLLSSRYFVDFHQVKLPVANPFWIFPFTRGGFEFARAVAPDVPLITHWGKGFSADGQCSDEFVNKNGGCGVTIELGQNSFDPLQIGLGLQVALRAIAEARARLSGEGQIHRRTAATAPLYTWGEVIPYPATGAPVLDPGWNNFMPVRKGQRLGAFQGQEVTASLDGWMLFPKYPEAAAEGAYGSTPPAAELARILKEISPSELPS